MNRFLKTSLVSILVGAAMGSLVTYRTAHRSAVRLEALAKRRMPLGTLVATAKGATRLRVALNLESSYGSKAHDPIRYHHGAVSSFPFGTISFSYPTVPLPGQEDVILVGITSSVGVTRHHVLVNGAYGRVYEDDAYVLSYEPNPPR